MFKLQKDVQEYLAPVALIAKVIGFHLVVSLLEQEDTIKLLVCAETVDTRG